MSTALPLQRSLHVPRERTTEDVALVRRAQRGDRVAQEQLYRRHAADLTRVVTRLLARRHDADDVVQDTFALALVRLGSLRDPSSFRSWLHRIAIRKVHKVWRRRRLLRRLGIDAGIDDASLAQLSSSACSPDAYAELVLLDEALAELSAELRAVWMLRHVEGESLERIADLAQCSLATVKRRLARARRIVERHIGGGR